MSVFSKTYTALSLIQAILNTKDERDFGDPLSRCIMSLSVVDKKFINLSESRREAASESFS